MEISKQIIRKLQHSSGLFVAAPIEETGYNKVWLRDNIYEAMALEVLGDVINLKKVYHALFDIFLKHEYKLDYAIKIKPQYAHQYIHARYNIETLDEFWDEWGNKQNDSIGLFLFKVGELEDKGIIILRDQNDVRILEKLVQYLKSIEYYKEPDHGIWEEHDELHSSSIGACVAGLKSISRIIDVENELIEKGLKTLEALLPRESNSKESDLALLSLIYPFNIVNANIKNKILINIEKNLVKKKGVIRYIGDKYYYKNGEAEWPLGLIWLALIYKKLGDKKKYLGYMKKVKLSRNAKGEFPELYYSNSDIHNENSPLGWAQALYLVLLLEKENGIRR